MFGDPHICVETKDKLTAQFKMLFLFVIYIFVFLSLNSDTTDSILIVPVSNKLTIS